MMQTDDVLFDGTTEFGHYQVVDTTYDRRPARVLYSGNRSAAQSGLARDDNPTLLFDYNQRFFELIDALRPKHVLLIGGGAYTLPSAALQAFDDVTIDVVELDGDLPDIAAEFFGLQLNHPRLRLFHQDGREFLETTDNQYDLILLDVFSGTTVPRALTTLQAAGHLGRHLRPDGVLAMNIIATYFGRNELVRRQLAAFAAAFRKIDVFPAGEYPSFWLPQNLVIVAQKGRTKDMNQYLRYEALEPLEVRIDEAVADND